MSNQVPEEVIEEIKNSNDIVDVVGEYVQLKKQGKSYVGLCPFHGEKTPSFSVTKEKQIFHCFGCGKGGNVITFLMEMESFTFYETLKYLADKSGVSLPDQITLQDNHSFSTENQSVLSAYEWLTKLYHHLLRYTKDGKEGLDYLKERGIREETIDLFQLGYAPNEAEFTATFLQKKGFEKSILVQKGILTQRDDNSVTDRFKGRVVFPIRNHIGKTVGFGGRNIHGQTPKYLNSSESDLFQKGRLLYNFDMAKKHIRKANEVVLFEGYMDVIAAYQGGVQNVIATLGTAITEFQAKLLKRYVDKVIICYDGDDAGVEAAFKAASVLKSAGCEVKIARLESDMDPDSFIKSRGGEAFQNEVIQTSETYMTFYMRYFRKKFNLSIEADRINYIKSILKELALIDSSVEREYYLKELSTEFQISMETLNNEVYALRENLSRSQKDKQTRNSYSQKVIYRYHDKNLLPAYHNAERQLIAHMLFSANIASKVEQEIGADFNIEDHKLIVTYLYAYYEEGNQADVSLFIQRLNEDRLKELVSEIAMLPVSDEISDKEIDDYIWMIRAYTNDSVNIRSLKEQQNLALQQNNPIKAAQFAMQIIEMRKKLKQ